MYQAYTTSVFILLLIIPLLIFVYCYGRIVAVIRRQLNKVSPAAAAAATANSHQSASAEQSSSAAASAMTTPSDVKTRTRRNVIRTLLLVTVSYFVCWFPIKFYFLAVAYDRLPINGDVIYALTLVSYVNILVNPVIYGTHFNVGGRTLRAIRVAMRRATAVDRGTELVLSTTNNVL